MMQDNNQSLKKRTFLGATKILRILWNFMIMLSETCRFLFAFIVQIILFAQVVDMRWGVRDEMTNEHMTTALCMTEVCGYEP